MGCLTRLRVSALRGFHSVRDCAHVDCAQATFEIGDAQALPIEAASSDAVLVALVAKLVRQPRRVVAEMARVRDRAAAWGFTSGIMRRGILMRYFCQPACH